MNDLMFTLNALLPIILVILIGYFLKKIKLFDKDFFKKLNKLCFRVCLPVLLFKNVYDIDSLNNINWKFIGYIVAGILVLFIIGFIIVKFTVPNDKQKGVILQAFFRSNYAIIGIPLAASLAAGIAGGLSVEESPISQAIIGNAAIASAFSIPLFNVLAVIALSVFDKGQPIKEENVNIEGNTSEVESVDKTTESVKSVSQLKKVLLNICKNPLIIGVLTGIIFLGIRSMLRHFDVSFTIKDDTEFLYETIAYIARVATPLALLALGGGFEFKAVSRLKKQIIFAVSVRVICVPVAGLLIAYALGFRELEFPALIGIFATPVAVSSAPMAAEMHQDEELAGQLVVWTTILTTISLFIIIMMCRKVGIF